LQSTTSNILAVSLFDYSFPPARVARKQVLRDALRHRRCFRLPLFQNRHHFFIRNLAKIFEELAHGIKIRRYLLNRSSHRTRAQWLGQPQVEATATAPTSFFGLLARTARNAAVMVDPVAMPSSTTMTIRPRGSIGARSGV
jgi:hypothetical protein